MSSAALNGNNVLLTIGTGSINLIGAKNKEITIVDSTGSETTTILSSGTDSVAAGLTYNSDKTAVTVGAAFKGALSANAYESTVNTISAANRGKAINITGNSNNNSIVGSAKNDTISGGTGRNTLVGGKGNDTLTGGKGTNTFVYSDGDGKDVITDFKTGDTFKLGSGSISKIATKSNNVIVTVGNGTVTFKDAKTKTIAIDRPDGIGQSIVNGVNVITVNSSNSSVVGLSGADSIITSGGDIGGYALSKITISGGAGNDTIRNLAATNSVIDGGAGNDYLYHNRSSSTVLGGASADTIEVGSNSSQIEGGAGNDSIYVSCGSNSGNTIIGGKGNDTITFGERQDNYTAGNHIIQYANGDGKDVIENYSDDAGIIQITKGSISAVSVGKGTAASDVIFKVGSGSITVKDGVGKKISIMDSDGNLTTQAYGASLIAVDDTYPDTLDTTLDTAVLVVDGTERTKDIAIIGNSKANTLIGGSGDDILTGGKGKDLFVYTGGNDVITDYKAGEDFIKFNNTYETVTYVGESKTDLQFTFVDGGTLTIENVIPVKSVKGVMTKQTPQKVRIIDKNGIDTGAQIYGAEYASTINVVNSDGDTIKPNLDVDCVDASKHSKPVYIIGTSGIARELIGGSGNDTISAFGEADMSYITVTGGKGKDLFAVRPANEIIITDYTAGQDKIQMLSGSTITGYEVEGKDVIFYVDVDYEAEDEGWGINSSGWLIVKNGKDKQITIIDDTGKETTEKYSDVHELVLTKDDGGKSFNLGTDTYTDVTKVDATKTVKGVTLIANDSGNVGVSISGGKGADSITLGNGADTVLYTTGYGNDTITNYSAEDVIELGKKTTISGAKISGDDYIFTIGKGKLTVKDGANQTITFVDSDNNRIRYDVRAYSERWFAEDDNFAGDNFAGDNFGADEVDSLLNETKTIANTDYKISSELDDLEGVDKALIASVQRKKLE